MADNTQLQSGSGGDTIRTDELIDEGTNAATSKAQAIKILLGGDGVDGGFVTKLNPLPVADNAIAKKLDTIIELLERIADAVEA